MESTYWSIGINEKGLLRRFGRRVGTLAKNP
jgi:hypothetical protein